MPWKKTYIAIDLKSFYASQECMARGLDPLTTNLVVADASRTEKTICLAVSPSLKARGIPGRPRLFEVVQKVQEINALRRCHAPGGRFSGASWDDEALKKDPSLAVDYIVAEPHMAQYVACSTRVYEVYLKYVAPEDIHVYSIDEVFMDVTPYLKARGMTARDFAAAMIRDVQAATGITATAGIGPNLYLCKVAMDIVAKHVEPDRDGVRIARLDENSYRRLLWGHQPLTDFWRVGRGYAEKLEKNGLFTMGDIARCSLGGPNAVHNETLLYRLFGVNAELLIDHAWGRESCTMADVKAYRPQSSSLGSGQVLQCPYRFEQARLIVKEMTDQLALDLVDKGLVTDQITLTVGYDRESLQDPAIASRYRGEVGVDYYGRRVPRHAHGTAGLGRMTSSARLMTEAMMNLFDRIVHPALLVRRVTVVAARVAKEQAAQAERGCEQLDFFTDYEAMQRRREAEDRMLAGEKRRQQAVLDIRRRFGKNAILLGMNLQEGGTTIQRNNQIGGHKA